MLSSSNNMSNNSSYSNDRSSFDTEYAVEASAGSFFHSDFKKHEDLKEMLDSNKDSLKLEAMKRIIGMIAKGRDASMLFPAVVKNVVSKNIEVKKLVYVYLERYAEEQQDLALLSISTFQRALKEPNQLIRAGALRVLSSIRVKMISPIIMLAIKDASSDMSPYVRKTAAHAIPKLYSIDNELKSELITIIQKLLADKTVLVIGSAVMAFTEVCPDRIDLIHQVFRKLCALIADVDEWGQVTILNMLTRYARTQFADPNLHENEEEPDRPFYDSNSDTSDKPAPSLDPDHRLLLRSTRPLLLSRNAAVVMAVAQLYYHAAPKTEYPITAKALIRLLRSHVEVQSVVLSSIASITIKNKNMFEPHLRSFFVLTSDPTNIKLLKLEILTNLTTDSNVSIILRELQTYISSSDKYFVAATIQAIGRCACSIPEVTDSCLNGLVSLLSNRDEAVVAESVVVIKRLLQTQAADPKEIITHMARLLDSITVAQARAAILWLLGEHSQKVPLIAPDVLRKMAITFGDEDDIVKLQIMNLSIKLYITNYEQTSRLCQYIFNLARYDQNYDIRDKARLFKHIIHSKSRISSQAATIFLTSKPAPLSISLYREPQTWQLGSLSHYIKLRAVGYEDLPPFPEIPPPGDVRNVEPIIEEENLKSYKQDKKKDMFSWESEQSSGTNSSSDSASSSDSSDSESDSSEDEDDDDEDDDDDEEEDEEGDEEEEQEDEDEDDEEEDESTNEESSEEHLDKKFERELTTSATEMASKDVDETSSSVCLDPLTGTDPRKEYNKNDLEYLLSVDPNDTNISMPVMKPVINYFRLNDGRNMREIKSIYPRFTPDKSMELLNRIDGKGLSIDYSFTRLDHINGLRFLSISLTFKNHLNEHIENIQMGKRYLVNRQELLEFTPIEKLAPNSTVSDIIGIDFNNSTQPVNFEIESSLEFC